MTPSQAYTQGDFDAMTSLVRLVACLALCFAVAAVGGLSTYPSIPTWYAGLVKPGWTPPNWVFPVVWNTLYLLMSVSLWLLWDRTPASPRRSRAIVFFLVQLALNFVWSPVFFTLHWVWPAFGIIVVLWLAILATIVSAWPVQRTAGLLLVPYLLWVSYASTLNAGIGVLNRGG